MDQSASFELGVLDFCNVPPGTAPHEAIYQSLDLAPRVEGFGYTRYWLAEHHTSKVAHSCPELLVPLIAGVTNEIRVGTAGVLLRYHNPLKLAKAFQLLHLVFPDRIDMGIARSGSDAHTNALLLEGRTDEIPYESKFHQLLELMRGDLRAHVNPVGVAPPDIWTLGTGWTSMRLAAREGTAFCLALFLKQPEPPTPAVVDEYRETFQAHPMYPAPRWSIGVAGVCAESEAKARALIADHSGRIDTSVVGTPAQCRAAFEELAERYGTRQFTILDMCQRFEDRVASYQLFAEALGVIPRQPR